MTKAQGVVDPAVLDRLSNLELVARRVVEGLMAGQHRSPLHGSSSEFAQHRQYAPGDELRRLDWKVFARSNRLVVKQYVEETSLSLNLLVDGSESMGYGSLEWTKLDYARWCAAALTHLVLGQRDTVGLVVFDEDWRAKVPPGNGGPQKVSIFQTLEAMTAEGPTAVGKALERLAPRLRQRGLTAVFSDFFEDVDQVIEGVKHLLSGGHEPILFQVLDPAELDFTFDHLVRFDGMEATGQRKLDPRELREAYQEEIKTHNQRLARAAAGLNVDLVSIRTDEPLDAVLAAYLDQRSARARGGGRS